MSAANSRVAIAKTKPKKKSLKDIALQQAKMSVKFTSRSTLALAYLIIPGNENESKLVASLSKAQLFNELVNQVHPSLQQRHASYIGNLPAPQSLALQTYQSNSEPINQILRGLHIQVEPFTAPLDVKMSRLLEEPDQLLEQATKKARLALKRQIKERKAVVQQAVNTIADLQVAVLKAPRLKRDWQLYRGISAGALVFALDKSLKEKQMYSLEQLNLEHGDSFETLGFNSFSSVPWVAVNFLGNTSCCIYRLLADSNVPNLAYPMSRNFQEFEVLLPPAKFRVIDKQLITSSLSKSIVLTVYDLEYVKSLPLPF